MSNSTGAELVTSVRQRSARTNDTVLITVAFVLVALNEAQVSIVRRLPRITALDKSNKTTYSVDRWSLTAVTPTVVSRTSQIVTLTAAGHGLAVGDIATVADVEDTTDFSGIFEILSVATNDVTYYQNKADDAGATATFGTVVKTADKPTLDISTLDPAHIGGIWLLNDDQTRRSGIRYRPWLHFQHKHIRVAEQPPGEPTEYTRKGDTLYFDRPVSRDYQGLRYKIDYTAKATDLLNGAVASELPLSDKGLKLFALAEVFDTLALTIPRLETKALKTRALYQNWLDEYTDYQEMLIEELYKEYSNVVGYGL